MKLLRHLSKLQPFTSQYRLPLAAISTTALVDDLAYMTQQCRQLDRHLPGQHVAPAGNTRLHGNPIAWDEARDICAHSYHVPATSCGCEDPCNISFACGPHRHCMLRLCLLERHLFRSAFRGIDSRNTVLRWQVHDNGADIILNEQAGRTLQTHGRAPLACPQHSSLSAPALCIIRCKYMHGCQQQQQEKVQLGSYLALYPIRADIAAASPLPATRPHEKLALA